jgi:hypothetical protein
LYCSVPVGEGQQPPPLQPLTWLPAGGPAEELISAQTKFASEAQNINFEGKKGGFLVIYEIAPVGVRWNTEEYLDFKSTKPVSTDYFKESPRGMKVVIFTLVRMLMFFTGNFFSEKLDKDCYYTVTGSAIPPKFQLAKLRKDQKFVLLPDGDDELIVILVLKFILSISQG